jgi:hypothetical protein
VKISLNFSTIALALIVTAIVPVLAMIVLTRIDLIVHRVLYDFGLLFSYRWAIPYWVNSSIIIGLSWFNLIASAALIYYVIKRRPSSMMHIQTGTINASAEKMTAIPRRAPPQTLDQFCHEHPQIKKYDARHPAGVIDSQC